MTVSSLSSGGKEEGGDGVALSLLLTSPLLLLLPLPALYHRLLGCIDAVVLLLTKGHDTTGPKDRRTNALPCVAFTTAAFPRPRNLHPRTSRVIFEAALLLFLMDMSRMVPDDDIQMTDDK